MAPRRLAVLGRQDGAGDPAQQGRAAREKYGRARRYWPAERRDEHAARLMAELLRSAGDRGVTLRSFLTGCLTTT
jgi:hypothetical protein